MYIVGKTGYSNFVLKMEIVRCDYIETEDISLQRDKICLKKVTHAKKRKKIEKKV